MDPRPMRRGPRGKPSSAQARPAAKTGAAAGSDLTEAAHMRELAAEAARGARPDPSQERILLQEAGAGGKAAQEKLLQAHLDDVLRLAAAHAERGLSISDLIQEGSIGLVEAIVGFSASGRDNFAAYAEEQISFRIGEAIEAESAAAAHSGRLIEDVETFERVEVLLMRLLKREPTEDQMADKLEWSVQRVSDVRIFVAEARRRHDAELLQYLDPDLDPADFLGPE